MNINTLQKLEFDQITKNLSNLCTTYKGKEIASLLVPRNNFDDVSALLLETDEAINLTIKAGTPSFIEIADIRSYIKILNVGSSLSLKAILELSNILKLAEDLKTYFSQEYIKKDDFSILNNLFSNLYSNSSITKKIFSCVLDENTLDDNASKDLKNIRKSKRKLEQDIRSKLNDMIHSSSFSKYIQENIVTIRNERFVIPVKEEYRSQVKGLVHDISNAGSTVFIEPISVFEMNNTLNELSVKEEIEIEKILQELTSLFIPYQDEIENNILLIGKLDFIFAKAKLSKNLNANIPKLNTKKEVHLLNARHPLIEKDVVVPITLSLGDDFSVLLITGPNTGGKTVTLKTVGLLTLMACSGLAIPADENSSIYVFDNIFADIGDDQSIADSLSTFSSHIKNIVNIVNHATSNSLVLVDELGSGTDPLEGANLAISILENLHNLGSLIIATTHYPELKQYALVTNGFENASVEFNIKTLTPTYKLLVGVPGKSNAFEISKTLGLNTTIIENAKSRMSSQDINIEDLLKNIYDTKASLESEKQEIDKKLENITKLETSLLHSKESLQNKEQELINTAKVKARNILLEAKEDANEIISKMNSNSSNMRENENLRNKLNSKIKNLKVNETYKNSDSKTNLIPKEQIKPNVEVFVKSLGKNGTVLSHISKSDEVQVQVGILKLNLSITDLEIAKSTKNPTTKVFNFPHGIKSKTAKTEINVIGLNVDEAIFVVDKFLDDCVLAKLQTARIVHGKGTGKLKNGIHQFLKKHPQVKDFRIGTFGEGDMGVTIVSFK